MALNTDGVNIIITGDASQAIKAIQDTQKATETLKGQSIDVNVGTNIDALVMLRSANSQFITMGEYFATQFSSGFMKNISKISGNFDIIGKNLEATFGSAFKVITEGAKTVAGSLSLIAKRSLAIGGGFESQMTTVKVISGATGEELAALTQKAREMGATLPISAKDAAMAMTVMAQRGTSVKDILTSVSDVANLAISQGVSMRDAADLLGSTITNFGLAMEDASKVTAIFNNASNQSALNMSKLTMAMKYVGPTAGSIGMELTEAMAAMEALANAGLTGEMTGTGLAMVLTKLASKTRIMGVETKDMQGKMRPLADIFSELRAKGFSLVEATAEFGARGRLAALNLAKQSESLKENEERLKLWGSTQAAVAEKSKTFNNTMMAFRSAVEEIHIEIFDQIKDKAKGSASVFTEFVRALSEWVKESKFAEKTLQAFFSGFNITLPTGADFKKLLAQIDVDALADKFRTLGSTLKSIVDGIVSFADKIRTPLLFLIKHLDTFANISFWGWITGKALQVPMTLVMMAAGFTQLFTALKALVALNFSSILGFLTSPVFLGAAGIAAIGTVVYQRVAEVKDAYNQLHEAEEKEKRYLQEQAQADSTIEVDIQTNIKTGFEKLPESWIKASDELRAQANVTVQAIREAFKKNVVTAIDAVIAKFPDMADALNDSVGNLSNATLSQLSKVLQGNEEAFNSLPPHMKKVVEQLYYMDVQAGQVTGSLGKLLIGWKELEEKAAAGNKPTKSQLAQFTEEISASVRSLLDDLPANVEKLQEFLSGQNLEVPVNVSLAQAQKAIQELSKSLGEKFNIPADIVSEALFSRLQVLADQGNKTAQSLYNGWKGATQSLDSFMQSAQDAVKYLGASPEKFSPALNSLTQGIQKIDPLTGKVTEQFKKAYDALKQWSNITFDQLAQRIQRLRKAVEGGFIDESALEAEFKRTSQQVKLQIATELQPTRESYKSQEGFNSVVASEYVARMGELGGEAFMQLLQREFSGLYDQSGAAIGAAIMRQVDNGLNSEVVMKINGIDMLQKEKQSQPTLDFSNISKVLTDSVSPLVSRIEQISIPQVSSSNDISSHFPEVIAAINNLQARIDNNSSLIARANDAITSLASFIGNINTQSNTNPVLTVQNYSSQFANVITEIQAVSARLADVQSIVQANVNAVNEVTSAVVSVNGAVSSVEAAVKSQHVSLDGNTISSAVAPLLTVVQNIASTESAIHSIEQYQSTYLNEITNSINTLDSSVKNLSKNSSDSSSSESFSGALVPLVNAVQSLSNTVGNIQTTHQANSSAIESITNAVKAVESAVKSINAGNNYDIDINQQGFIVEKKADADLVARNTASALRSGLGNGVV